MCDLKYFAETNSAVVVLSNGDIVNVVGADESIPGSEPTIEIVGSIDGGIHDAKWSPDEEILALATPKSMILLSKVFDPIEEMEIDVKDLSMSKHVSVGWGKKETQFQGKGAKAKALRDPTVPVKVDQGTVCPGDDGKRTVSWRGDGEYVSVSCTDIIPDESQESTLTRRTIRVYSRNGELNSVSEPVDTMEHQVAWRPSGNVIASVQRDPSRADAKGPDLIFFERNGLRRYEFSLRIAYDTPVLDLAWNLDSEVLAVHLPDRIQLWTTKNYHWYLKQEIVPRKKGSVPSRIMWHPEKPLSLLICYQNGPETHLETHQLLWSTISGSTYRPDDFGITAVVDGSLVKVTPLAIANTPPPMSYTQFEVECTPINAAVSKTGRRFGLLLSDKVAIAEWDTERLAQKRRPASPSVVSTIDIADLSIVPKQVAFVGDDVAAVAGDCDDGSSAVFLLSVDTKQVLASHKFTPEVFVIRSRADFEALLVETIDGTVHSISSPFDQVEQLVTMPQRCETICGTPEGMIFGLSGNGKLYANTKLLSPSVTSLMLTESHAIVTTAQHYLKFCHIMPSAQEITIPADDSVNDERCRAIERGSLLVAVVPSKTCLTLQAPRGNLETVFPRIMVLTEVRKHISNLEYRAAFALCRAHRIDLNILHDYAHSLFKENTALFLDQLKSTEYIDLFLSGLKNEDVSETMYKQTLQESEDPNIQEKMTPEVIKNKVNIVCDLILKVLNTEKYKKAGYLQSILTAFACKDPADLESALEFVSALRSKNIAEAEEAIQHLCFLQDVELLYNTALGLYDLDLTLLVAQQSQKDPKEYLPFLQELQKQDLLRRKFSIDTHLKKYSKALGHLAEMEGEDSFQEALEYIKDHQLYKDALKIYRYSSEKQKAILHIQAPYLQGKRLYSEAALVYEYLGENDDALDAYQLAGDWRQALALVHLPEFDQERRDDVTQHLADLTLEWRQYKDSAVINLEYLKDIAQAVRCYCKGYLFDDAIRICTLHKLPELLEKEVDPILLESFSTISELLADCKGQVESQVKRIRELREKKTQDPLAFYGGPDASDAPDNVSLAPTETSTAPSFFTRYTGKTGGTAKTGASRKTAKNRRREERKRARGKKGSIYEEEYLINSMSRLVERLDTTEPDAVSLIEGLLKRNMRDHAYQIQREFVLIRQRLSEVVGEVFTVSDQDRERYDDDGNIYYVDPPKVPEIKSFPRKESLDY